MWPFTRRRRRAMVSCHGFDPAIRDIAVRATSESLLRGSVNSAIVVLAIDDIASHNFYRHHVHDMLGTLEGPIAWIVDLPCHLRPFVSPGFGSTVASELCDSLIAVFARYYMCRLPLLTSHQWFIDIPPDVGPSNDDLREVSVRLADDLSRLFPNAWCDLAKGGPQDPESIFQTMADGKLLAERHDLESPEVRDYLMPRDDLVTGIMAALKAAIPGSNTHTFVSMHLERLLGRWWYDFRRDYADTFKQWYFAGAFVGGHSRPSAVLWPAVHERLQRREWLIRLGAGW